MRTFDDAPEHDLSERERHILCLVVKSFIDTAGPIGSRSLARQHPAVNLSPASIRNTMSDLEEMGYLDHPYTSAGRVPTERGYRAFVDDLMEPELSPTEKDLLTLQLAQLIGDAGALFRESSRLLGRLTNLLGVVLSPRLSTGVLERLDVVPLSGARLMFVLGVRGGLVKTIVLEVEADVRREDLGRVVSILNERLAGLTLAEIRRTHRERVRDVDDAGTGLVRLILDESNVLFSEATEGRLLHSGAHHMLAQPEFQDTDDLRALIALLEDEDSVVHLLEDEHPRSTSSPRSGRAAKVLPERLADEAGRALVRIGSENSRAEDRREGVERYSIVTSSYQLGEAVGTVGVIGPTRMDYARVVALVENAAALMSRPAA